MFDRTKIDWPLEVQVCPQFNADPADLRTLTIEIANDCAEFSAIVDDESACVLVGACEERQLDQNLVLLQSKLVGNYQVGRPQVGYREAIREAVDVDETLESKDGLEERRLRFRLEPRKPGSGNEIKSEAVDAGISSDYAVDIESAIGPLLNEGVLQGFPLIDLTVTLVSGHVLFASEPSLSIADTVRRAFREALLNARVILMEPLVLVKVISPEEFLGGVMGDLNTRRGHIIGTEHLENCELVRSHVPIAKMFGYANALAAMTQDRASYSVQPSHYQEVQPDDWMPPEAAAAALVD